MSHHTVPWAKLVVWIDGALLRRPAVVPKKGPKPYVRCCTCRFPKKVLEKLATSEKLAKPNRPLATGVAAMVCVYRHDVRAARGEVPVGRGALDETFDLAYETEQTTATSVPQAGVFLGYAKCYERIPLHTLETFALESGYPRYALYAGFTLRSAGRHIAVRKYVDDMVLVAKGHTLAGNLCYGYRQVHKSLTAMNMKATAPLGNSVGCVEVSSATQGGHHLPAIYDLSALTRFTGE
eukprot:6461432-Amphidinium_carterae.3